MASKFGTWRKKIQHHPVIAMGIVVLLIVLIAFALAVYWWGWDWTGFTGGESKTTTVSTSTGITTATERQPGKTLWDVLQLLAVLAIPIVAGIGAAWFTAQQGKVSERE